MSESNPVITLEPLSLYIVTNQIMNNMGKFHWSIYTTDATGEAATKYHWKETSGAQSPKAERVDISTIDPVTTYDLATELILNFAFIKVNCMTLPAPEIMKEFCEQVFPDGGYATVRENRQARLTCRTWLFRLLSALRREGYLQRQDSLRAMEAAVIQISTAEEFKVANGTRGSYSTVTAV